MEVDEFKAKRKIGCLLLVFVLANLERKLQFIVRRT